MDLPPTSPSAFLEIPDNARLEATDSTATMVASGVVTGLATIAVALRFFVRIRYKAGLGWDDWWILIALIITLLTGGLLLWSNFVDPDGGVAAETESPDFNYAPHVFYLKIGYISSVTYFSIIGATKVSILLMYRRIFSVKKSFRLQSLVVLGVVSAFWLATTIAALANCIPMEQSWLTSLSPAKYCINYNIFWMVTGAVEVVIDATILALPVRVILGLQLSVKRKLSIVFIFLLGSFVVITGMLRCIYSYRPGSRVPSVSGRAMVRYTRWHGDSLRLLAHAATAYLPLFVLESGYPRLWHYHNGLLKLWSGKSGQFSKSKGEMTTESTQEEQPLQMDSIDPIIKSPQAKDLRLADMNKPLPEIPTFLDIELGFTLADYEVDHESR